MASDKSDPAGAALMPWEDRALFGAWMRARARMPVHSGQCLRYSDGEAASGTWRQVGVVECRTASATVLPDRGFHTVYGEVGWRYCSWVPGYARTPVMAVSTVQ